jgi:homoserine kinase
MTDRVVTAFAPATVSNVACGFDVLGFALEAPGDEVSAWFTGVPDPQVRIDDIAGDDGRLPREAARNTAGVAAQALLTALGERRGIAISIRKGLPLSSGLGGSAASAAAAVKASGSAPGRPTPTTSRPPSAGGSFWCAVRVRRTSSGFPYPQA